MMIITNYEQRYFGPLVTVYHWKARLLVFYMIFELNNTFFICL